MGSIGYKPTGATPDFLRFEVGNPYNYRAYVPDPAIETGWATSLTMRTGKTTGTTPDLVGVVFAANPTPGAIIQTTATQHPTTTMTDGTQGSIVTYDLLDTFKIFSGDQFALGAIGINGVGMGMTGLANIPGKQSYAFYSRDDGALPPADPMGFTDVASFEGWMAIALNYDKNIAPNTPFNRKFNGIGATTTSMISPTGTPTFEADFADTNETLSNGLAADYLNLVEILVTRVSDGHVMWSLSDVGTSAERSARHATRTYAGSTLAADGTAYQWQMRFSDRMGFFSSWSSALPFTVGAGQMVVTGTSPIGTISGKQETQTPGPFVAKWTHSGGLATTKVKLRILDDSGGVYATSGEITKAVLNNANSSVSWADTAFAAGLPWGRNWSWQQQGKASDGNWSGWSTPVAFSTNAAPSVPTGLTPDGVGWTAPGTLTFSVTDADDTTATGLVAKVEIFNSAGTQIGSAFSATKRAGANNLWDLVTSATHFPSYDDYTWRAYSGDGTLWSGAVAWASEASAQRSATAAIHYAAGPALTITAPTDGSVITTATPVVSWTAPTQAAYRVFLYDLTDGGGQILDSNTVVTTVTGYTVPDGEFVNGHTHRIKVRVTDSFALTSEATVDVTLTYTDPDPIVGYLLSPISMEGDDGQPSAVLISFTPSTDPNFAYYLITREPASGQALEPEDRYRDKAKVKIFREYDVNTTRFIDYSPASGVAYQYKVAQFVTQGSVTTNSIYAVGQIMVTFDRTIIYDVTDPEGLRAVLPYREPRTQSRTRDQTLLPAWNQIAPTALRGKLWYKTISGVYPVIGDSKEDVRRTIRNLDFMDSGPNVLLFRNGDGARVFGRISDLQDVSPGGGGIRRVSLSVIPVNYVEDV